MFVRFRERPNDARQPHAVSARLACSGRCREREGQRLGADFRRGYGCPERPRCRWRIAGELVPYRLLVSLVESERDAGRVRQVHVADLGAIEGYLLSGFFAGSHPEIMQDAGWQGISLDARHDFWTELDTRLGRLSNRITDADAQMIHASIEQRIPRPTEAEVAACEVALETAGWARIKDSYEGVIERDRKSIATYERRIEASRQDIATSQSIVEQIDRNRAVLEKRLSEGTPDIVKRSAKVRQGFNMTLGKTLAARVLSG